VVIDVSVAEPVSVVPAGRLGQMAVVLALTASGDDITKLTGNVSLVVPLLAALASVVIDARASAASTPAKRSKDRIMPTLP
jgi:hypothetical protein